MMNPSTLKAVLFTLDCSCDIITVQVVVGGINLHIY